MLRTPPGARYLASQPRPRSHRRDPRSEERNSVCSCSCRPGGLGARGRRVSGQVPGNVDDPVLFEPQVHSSVEMYKGGRAFWLWAPYPHLPFSHPWLGPPACPHLCASQMPCDHVSGLWTGGPGQPAVLSPFSATHLASGLHHAHLPGGRDHLRSSPPPPPGTLLGQTEGNARL